MLYDEKLEKSNCGVGFITRKDGRQTHEILEMGHQALCRVPHRGGMSSKGIGDGAGISIDLSVKFFSKITKSELKYGSFAVGNFFLPNDKNVHKDAEVLIERSFKDHNLKILKKRMIEVNNTSLNSEKVLAQLPIRQWIIEENKKTNVYEFEKSIYKSLIEIESKAFRDEKYNGLYPLSLSSKMQVFKGRLNSNEIIPYFVDLSDPDQAVKVMYFHTRFSTNTEPQPSMAQPFRFIAHNGELNTDKKNRISENAIALSKNRNIIGPNGQSDSCRLDQTLQSRICEDDIDIVTAVVSMMPPAWEKDKKISQNAKEMLEYFSLYEEKNDGPAALIFCDGNIVGARLDRLGLRPLRTTETTEYLAVMSEAGQIDFSPGTIISLGRIEAGGMLYFDHSEQKIYHTDEAIEKISKLDDYTNKLYNSRSYLYELKTFDNVEEEKKSEKFNLHAKYVAYSHNQESFKFLMDPMLISGTEKVSAMGYGNAINALNDNEGGIAKYFSQRFAQVTNPPLDSIRELEGMTLRLALGCKPKFGTHDSHQLILKTPILNKNDFTKLKNQKKVPVLCCDMLFQPDIKNLENTKNILKKSISFLCEKIGFFAKEKGGIVILSDKCINFEKAPIPMILATSAINQFLIDNGLRMKVSLVIESGQVSSSHHVSCALGFGASAIYPLSVQLRAEEKFIEDPENAFLSFTKATEKALLKTMGKVGLCTVESYIGGEFFEPNFLNTEDPDLKKFFPHMISPVGGVGFDSIVRSIMDWHHAALSVKSEKDIPILGLFKERSEGAGHSFGQAAVRGFVDLTEEKISFETTFPEDKNEFLRLLTLNKLEDAFSINEKGYVNTSFERLDKKYIDEFQITPGYRQFVRMLREERSRRPAALRDVLDFLSDVSFIDSEREITSEMMRFNRAGNINFMIRGIKVVCIDKNSFLISLEKNNSHNEKKSAKILNSLKSRFSKDINNSKIVDNVIHIKCKNNSDADNYLKRIISAPKTLAIEEVESASDITKRFASGAMSHGALVATAHEAVAHGTNMVGAMSNSGEGGEHISRFGTIRASKIKQFASGRFGVWAAYLADPMLEEIEIKIGQGAKPGEGGQLPEKKVNVEIAAARGGTPGVELVSPPPHHDTYSIEDLAQLIHDAKAARVRVIVKLVSSEGIGTIAVGVAKAGADVINIAGNSGGTGAASVTSLKYTGRAAEIGLIEVHQALTINNIRQKVILRCSGAHQTGTDIVKSALLGAESFEFGTTALMMLKCVMAKNCNIKCPAGLTTNPEIFDGDPRSLAQYFVNVAHEVREVLAFLGIKSLSDAIGKTNFLHLLDHPSSVGQLNIHRLLEVKTPEKIEKPTYLNANYELDDLFLKEFKDKILIRNNSELEIIIDKPLINTNKSVVGQFSIDVEREINHNNKTIDLDCVLTDKNNRNYLKPKTVKIFTNGSAGQSFGAFCNDGISIEHTGTCNDGVGKSSCGGEIIIKTPDLIRKSLKSNVLVGNFALFGATGGKLFIEGHAGDRFAVRNSGATAVVEGVGEFFAEYMTNGAVLNIGPFSKGVGNGMSGGFAYQYDPYKILEKNISHNSVLFKSINLEDEASKIHSEAIKLMLEWHLEATNSQKAKFLLDNWNNEKENFYFIMPKALLQYQDADMILKTKSRKDLIEELAINLSTFQIRKLKSAWKSGIPINNGFVPNDDEVDSKKMFELINSHTVLCFAKEIVKSKLEMDEKKEGIKIRNLILTEDFKLMSRILNHAKAAIKIYDDQQLATMIASKRINDFKETLSLRNILSMDSPGTYGWILFQSKKNLNFLKKIPCFEELFAQNTISEVISSNRSSMEPKK